MKTSKYFAAGLILSSLFSLGFAQGTTDPGSGFPGCCTPPSTGTYPCKAPADGGWSKGQCNYGCQVNCGDRGTPGGDLCRQGCQQYDVQEQPDAALKHKP